MTAFAHQAFSYSSTAEFVDGLEPFVRDGIERGDRVLAVTGPTNREALIAALGDDSSAVDFRDADKWYEHPYRTLSAYGRYVDEHAAGTVVRVIGEPVWSNRTPAAVREWKRYESVLNVAFADAPAWIVCPYDASTLPAEIVACAAQTHPELWTSDAGVGRSPEYVAPHRFLEDADAAAGGGVLDASSMVLDGDDFAAVRRFAVVAGTAAGLPRERLDDLRLVVTELATNAFREGAPPVTIRTWVDGDEFVCEVGDGGPGFANRLMGYTVPSPDARSGRGLWIVRQLCECVDTVRADGRFAVRARLRRVAPLPSSPY